MITLLVYYTFHDGAKSTYRIESNCKERYHEEVLGGFLQDVVGSGVTMDEAEAIERDTYEITLRLDMDDDSYRWEHDCGAPGLAVGILMDVLRMLPVSS